MNVITEKNILLNSELKDKAAVISELAKTLAANGYLTSAQPENFIQAVMNREEDCPTAVGFGFAIPHGKSDAVAQAGIGYMRLNDGIVWDEDDRDELVNHVFILAIPQSAMSDVHMQILVKLSTAIIDDDFREQLEKAKTPNEIMSAIQNQSIL